MRLTWILLLGIVSIGVHLAETMTLVCGDHFLFVCRSEIDDIARLPVWFLFLFQIGLTVRFGGVEFYRLAFS